MKLNRNAIDVAEVNLDTAKKLYRDFAGHAEHGVTISYYVKYLICDDGQGRWLTTVEDYQDGLDAILAKAIEGEYEGDRIDEAYNDLCNECPAMYSRIGSGEYNSKISDLVALLDETLTRSAIEEICQELCIDLGDAEVDLDEICTEA